MNRKTLIILTPAFPANESEEESIWLPAKQSLIRALNRSFPELEIIILTFQFPVRRDRYTWNGNLVIPFSGGNKGGIHNWLVWLNVVKTLFLLKREKEIIGLLSFWCAECGFVAHYFSKLYRLKHYCWICGQDARPWNKFVKRIRPKPSELVAMSDFLQDEFHKNHGIRPAHLIPDAIDTLLFDKDKEEERTLDILGAGSFSPLKQYDVFIEVVAAIKEQLQHTKAILCGDGSERTRIEEKIKETGLEDDLKLTGSIPQKEVLRLMKRTKVFLHTSNYEGFGNVCIEALYAGAHVISFTKPMNQRIGQWHIVSTKEEMIARALELLQDRNTVYSSVLPFDMNDSAKQFMKLFQYDNER
ncbi:Glycosyltransferase involved in cell wall bisynthesis [Chitinophaga sp. YR573]|uniref:glycosyltransferase n=1 Tax=Chitinophaga sp. YR573 TaxID=1881040 RepID=UPI0008AA8C7B|nr:glycosyltransferase [Chitinophaga sp. YR573]SEW44824.1 Glycosyltransferase involved in cell wall bisynthesis [Chitinophaga sp. YR573]